VLQQSAANVRSACTVECSHDAEAEGVEHQLESVAAVLVAFMS
jgi:hypothetical protein